MKKGCCFAGHHKLPYSLESKIKVTEAVEDLIKQGVTEFYAGGVTGFNMLCSMVCFKTLRVTYPEIKASHNTALFKLKRAPRMRI